MKKAVCLLSGGLDSTVALYAARAEGYTAIALSVEYGQRHFREIAAARKTTKHLQIAHYFSALSMPWKGSALLDKKISIPENDTEKKTNEIPATYVPGRNSVFLAMAISCAEAVGAETVFIGANVLDYSGYPDCRPEYLAKVGDAIWAGTRAGVLGKKIEIKAPLISLTKKEIILLGNKLGVPFENTWSCYAGEDKPCGVCDSCKFRAKGFQEAGLSDPLWAGK